MEKYKVEEAKKGAYKGRGEPLEWPIVKKRKDISLGHGVKIAGQELSHGSETAACSESKVWVRRHSRAERRSAAHCVGDCSDCSRWKDSTRVHAGVGPGESIGARWSPSRVGLGDVFQFRKTLRVLCGYSEHQRRVQFEGCVAEPLQTITAILPGSKWSCLLLRIVLQDALSEVMKNYSPLKLRVFVDDITALVKRVAMELPAPSHCVARCIG